MRKLLFFLIGLGLALPLLAQDVSDEASEMKIQAEEAPPPPAGTNAPGVAATNQVSDAHLTFLVNTGSRYHEEGEYEEAERAYLRALEAAPGNASVRFRLSTLYVTMGRYTEAVPILEELVEE
ncbi:MAG: tetratricopeptide repeat protein, partial [Verrucomicrobia bacterium]|nr:tetratricopeptide repeat protein [Verrucomicrobiota bacterium]